MNNSPRSRLHARHFLVKAVLLIASLAVIFVLAAVVSGEDGLLFALTGEIDPASQAKGALQLIFDLFRQRPVTADYVPVRYAGLNPYGVNTFLEQEVEREKRELAVKMIADAGFAWIRQEFPWEDIEIHGKGDFEDRRHEPHRSAWEKYDHIVDLAEQYGLGLIVRLSNPPAWSRAEGNAAGALAPPDNFQDFGDYVSAVVSRYQGKVHYYQVWNEPNIYPEWGDRPVDPQAYVELLRVGYTRAKAVDPDVVIICGALASTIELDYRNLNDFAYLQQMYDAGAASYFDVLAMQGYGLWSGPTNRRMQPRVINFARPLYLRDIMVNNGDEAKPIWISEMNWNAVPDEIPDKPFGQVSEEQQARYAELGYHRIQQEWPWLGVANIWFFKRATDAEIDQAMYYFRMVEPDFTPLPIYHALQEYTSQPPALFRGFHSEDHWALAYHGKWVIEEEAEAVLGTYRRLVGPGSGLSFTFFGRQLQIIAPQGPDLGSMRIHVRGGKTWTVDLEAASARHQQVVWQTSWLNSGPHEVTIEVIEGQGALDGLLIYPLPGWWPAAFILAAIGLLGVGGLLFRAMSRSRSRRRPTGRA